MIIVALYISVTEAVVLDLTETTVQPNFVK